MCRIYGKNSDTAYVRLCDNAPRIGLLSDSSRAFLRSFPDPWTFACPESRGRIRDGVANMRDQEQLEKEGVVY